MKVEQLTLESDERILIQVRKHWFVLAMQLFSLIIVAIVPPVLYIIAQSSIATIVNLSGYYGVLIFFYGVWLLIMWMALFNVWTNYYLDVWTITNKRIIAVDQKGFFFRTTASFRYERLQDTIATVRGIIPTLLDYGTLEIQTAGVERNFKEYGLPSPGNLKGMILEATDTLMGKRKRL